MSKLHSRRAFLRFAGIGAAGALLAACTPKVVEKVVKETVIVEKTVEKEAPAAAAGAQGKEVRILLD